MMACVGRDPPRTLRLVYPPVATCSGLATLDIDRKGFGAKWRPAATCSAYGYIQREMTRPH